MGADGIARATYTNITTNLNTRAGMYRNGTHPTRAPINRSRFRGWRPFPGSCGALGVAPAAIVARRERPALQHPAASYVDYLAGDVVGPVGGEEFYGGGYVFGGGRAAHGGAGVADAAGFVGG